MLANKPIDVLLGDRHNFHTFTPLLYQVATCALDPSEIAYPVRSMFRHNPNVRAMLGEVGKIDYAGQHVLVNWVWNYFTYDRSVGIILEHVTCGEG